MKLGWLNGSGVNCLFKVTNSVEFNFSVNIKSVYSIRLLQGNKANLYHFAGIKELKMHLHMERRQRSYPGQQNNVKHAQD